MPRFAPVISTVEVSFLICAAAMQGTANNAARIRNRIVENFTNIAAVAPG